MPNFIVPALDSDASAWKLCMANGLDVKALLKKLNDLDASIPSESPEGAAVQERDRRTVRELALSVSERLKLLAQWLDPVRQPGELFDPGNPFHAAELIAQKLLQQPRFALGQLSPTYGAGVYAIYYAGPYSAYKGIAGTQIPIYVGKADPTNPRATTAEAQGTKLHTRLREHSKSIRAAETYAASRSVEAIEVADFECRFLPLASGFAGAVESALIRQFEPVWNTVCPGLGKHGDSSSTRANTRSEWDTLHPGRNWATHAGNKPNQRTAAEIKKLIQRHISALRTRLDASA